MEHFYYVNPLDVRYKFKLACEHLIFKDGRVFESVPRLSEYVHIERLFPNMNTQPEKRYYSNSSQIEIIGHSLHTGIFLHSYYF